MSTIIKKCNCNHTYQDKKYGNNKRVYNLSERGDKGTCTVCGNTKSV